MNTANNFSPASTTARLASLDILRGLDLFLLLFFQPVFVSLASLLDCHWLNMVAWQFDHEVWEGFRLWDIIMPLFLFMTGASIPFSLSRYERDEALRGEAYRKIARRFVLLFLLGMVVQGNLLGLTFERIYFYNNTLQAIATGYVVAAVAQLHLKLRGRMVLLFALLAVYSLPFMLTGDYTMEGNFANKIDTMLLGRFRDDWSYTWLWSSLTFAATALMGSLAGQIIKNGKDNRQQALQRLLVFGISAVLAGWIFGLHQPIIKRIWTASMTLYSGGICVLLLATLYYWVDIKQRSRGLMWLKIYGMNSIVAYVVGEVVNFRSVAHSLCRGLEQYMGDYYSVWLTFCNFLIVFLILRIMYKNRIFVKV